MTASPRIIDLGTHTMTVLFEAAPLYRKNSEVRIRAALPGEVVVTRTRSGTAETSITCKGGEPVVTQAAGEENILTGGWADVVSRYQDLGLGRYRAHGLIRAFPNPYGVPVRIEKAPWGSPQDQEADCVLATLVREDGDGTRVITSDRWLIGFAEFAYAPVR